MHLVFNMGRSIPSGTSRVNARLSDWEKFARLLPKNEADAFLRLAAHMRNRRNAIEAADDADIGVSMLLAAVTLLEGRNGVCKRGKDCLAADCKDRDGGT